MRLFFAFDLPTEQARELADLTPGRSRSVRPVPAGRMHVTLRFVGDVSPDVRDRLVDGLRLLAPLPPAEARTVRVEGVGVFPGLRRARVLWAGLGIHEGLVALQQAVEDVCRHAGLLEDTQAWHPHVTLARFPQGPPPDLEAWLVRHADLRFDPFVVDRFTLYDSLTLDGSVVYDPVASVEA